jgi:cation-transporting ATPase E
MRVISGDNPQTVASIARRVGMVFDGDGFDARDLPTDLDELGEVLERHLVFGRVTPIQKREMVTALQRRGHVVAMTGDGVNDALALKRADIGIAMGSGSAATRAVSRLVLLDGQFARLPAVVAEGRRVITNIERVSKLFLTKTVYALLLSVAIGVLLWKFPFLPRQFAPTDGLTLGIPAFFLAFATHGQRYRPGFLRRSLTFSVPAGIVTCVVIVVLVAFARSSGGQSERQLQTAAAIALSIVGLWVLGVVARPLNRWRALLVVGMGIALAGCLTVPLIQDFLNFQTPTGDLLRFALGAGIVGCLAIEIIHRVVVRLRERDDYPSVA